MYLDTNAEILFRLGKREEAITAITEAIEKGRWTVEYLYYLEQLKRFRGARE